MPIYATAFTVGPPQPGSVLLPVTADVPSFSTNTQLIQQLFEVQLLSALQADPRMLQYGAVTTTQAVLPVSPPPTMPAPEPATAPLVVAPPPPTPRTPRTPSPPPSPSRPSLPSVPGWPDAPAPMPQGGTGQGSLVPPASNGDRSVEGVKKGGGGGAAVGVGVSVAVVVAVAAGFGAWWVMRKRAQQQQARDVVYHTPSRS